MLVWDLILVLASASVLHAFHPFTYSPAWKFASTKENKWFDQKLDHFDPTNTKTWKQRYQVNGTWFKEAEDSPIFLIIGGEGSLSAGNMTARIYGVEPWMQYAKKFGAICFELEHRYYGESQPLEDLSVKNLRFLSSQQALADIAQFIDGMNKMYEFKKTNRWIVFGGSYAGSLAAWARLKFPHLVFGAIASSAPLVAVVDFKEYYNTVKQALVSSRESCAEKVHQGALDIGDLLKDPKGAALLSEKFELCEPFDPLEENETFRMSSLLIWLPFLVQYYHKFSTNVDDVCDIMVDESYGSLVERYAAVNSLVRYKLSQCALEPTPCLPNGSYKKTLETLRNTSHANKAESQRQWVYQTCTEFGFFKTSSTKDDLFGSSLSLDSYVSLCEDVFGEDFNLTRVEDGVQKTNTEYGGVNISVSRVVFVHGSMDPWRGLGVAESTNPDNPVIVIKGASHCNDMQRSQLFDPPNLKAARRQIMDTIGKWLSE